MSIDFRTDQIRTNKIIASGSTGTSGQLLIYSVSASSNLQGGIDTTKFDLTSIGTDVFMFVSGAINSIGTSTQGASVFGGDVFISGNLKIAGTLTANLNITVDAPQNSVIFSGSAGLSGSSKFNFYPSISLLELSSSVNSPGAMFVGVNNSVFGAFTSSISNVKTGIGLGYNSWVAARVKDNSRWRNLIAATDFPTDNTVFIGDDGWQELVLYHQTANIFLTGSKILYSASQGHHFTGSAYFTNGSALPIGTDVFFYVSGASGSIGTNTRGVSVFGGDVVISGTLKVGSGSIQILGNQNTIQFSPAMTIFSSASKMFFTDGDILTPVNLAALATTVNAWVEGSPSPRVRTSASVGIGNNFAQDFGSNVMFAVSGTRTTALNAAVPSLSVSLFKGDIVNSGTMWFYPTANIASDIRYVFTDINTNPTASLISIRHTAAGNTYDVLKNEQYYIVLGHRNSDSGYRAGVKIRGGEAILEGYNESAAAPLRSRVICNGNNAGDLNSQRISFVNLLSDVSTMRERLAIRGRASDNIEMIGGYMNVGIRNDFYITTQDYPFLGSDLPSPYIIFQPGLGYGSGVNRIIFRGGRRQTGATTQHTIVDSMWVTDWGVRIISQPTSSIPSVALPEAIGSLIFSTEDAKLKFISDTVQVREVYVSAIKVNSSSVATTGSTPILLQSLTLSPGLIYNIDSTVMAKQLSNNNRGRWVKNLLATHSGGLAMIQGDTVYSAFPDVVSTGSWSMNFEVSGSNLRLFVTGAISTIVSWSVNTELTPL